MANNQYKHDTRRHLSSYHFVQCKVDGVSGDTLTLSGNTIISKVGKIDSHSGYNISGDTIFNVGASISSLKIGRNIQNVGTCSIVIGSLSKDDSNNPVCRTHLSSKKGFTFGSVILTLSNKRIMQVTAGPPDESEYQTFSFDKH